MAALTAACGAEEGPPCPPPFQRDPERARSLVARLATTTEGARLLGAGRPRATCFGEPEVTGVTTEGVMLLDRRDDLDEGAARLGHLLLHLRDGPATLDPGDAGCAPVVDAALRGEARAIALELHLRRDLGVLRPRTAFDFADGFWAAPAPDREAFVLSYLRAHPDGAPGLDALASGYRRRCEAARRPPGVPPRDGR